MNVMDHPRVNALLDILQARLDEDEDHFNILLDYIEGEL